MLLLSHYDEFEWSLYEVDQPAPRKNRSFAVSSSV